jgi:hypothetical protein
MVRSEDPDLSRAVRLPSDNVSCLCHTVPWTGVVSSSPREKQSEQHQHVTAKEGKYINIASCFLLVNQKIATWVSGMPEGIQILAGDKTSRSTKSDLFFCWKLVKIGQNISNCRFSKIGFSIENYRFLNPERWYKYNTYIEIMLISCLETIITLIFCSRPNLEDALIWWETLCISL